MTEKEDVKAISYIVYEASQTRSERIIKRLIFALVIVTAMLFASNLLWLYGWTQYDYEGTQTVTVDGKDGIANYIGNDGEIVNGEDNGN